MKTGIQKYDVQTASGLYSSQQTEWHAVRRVTSNLEKRGWEHKNDLVDGFTKRYGVHRLVYYELHEDMMSAIRREKQMKKWNRVWKLDLIEKQNPGWRDLWEEII